MSKQHRDSRGKCSLRTFEITIKTRDIASVVKVSGTMDGKALQHAADGGWSSGRAYAAMVAPHAFVTDETKDCGSVLHRRFERANDVLDAKDLPFFTPIAR
jgi:hypothetical protein